MTRALSLSRDGDTIGLESPEFLAVQGASGFGMVPVTNRWTEGAGHGSRYRGTKVHRRVLPIPVLIRGADADELEDRFGRLATILDPDGGEATLTLDEGHRGRWYTRVVRAAGGDYVAGVDTNGSSWLSLPDLTLEAGDPTWTSVDPIRPVVLRPPGEGRGLLSGYSRSGYGSGAYGEGPYGSGPSANGGTGWSLTRLRLQSGQALGSVVLENPGTAPGLLVVVVQGPATRVVLQSPAGDVVEWSGALLEGQTRTFDFTAGTVVDGNGVNRYDELGPVPVWWSVPRGNRRAEVTLEGATSASAVTLTWFPRRWVVIP